MLPCLLAALTGCTGSADDPPAAEPPAIVTPPEKMQEHFGLAAEARDAIIAGDLPTAKEAVSRIVITPSPEPRELWDRHLATMKEAATRAALAEDIEATATELVVLARVCGDCHKETSGGPGITAQLAMQAPVPKPAGEGTPQHMVLHQWAAEQMWLGLVAPSPELFARAAAVLGEAPMTTFPDGKDIPKEIAVLEDNLHTLAKAAATTQDEGERATLYTELISTCATCHRAARPSQ